MRIFKKKQKKKIYLFDLDHTLVDFDSFKKFIFQIAIIDKILISKKIFRLFYYYLLHSYSKNKTIFKSKFIKCLIEGFSSYEIDKISRLFVKKRIIPKINKKLLKLIKLNRRNHKIYIVSASLNIYIKYIVKELKITGEISTTVSLNKKTFGKIIGSNCFNIEKKNRLKKTILNLYNKKIIFFTDDEISDLPLINLSDKHYIVKN